MSTTPTKSAFTGVEAAADDDDFFAAAEADTVKLSVRSVTASASKMIFLDDITELFLLFCVTLTESALHSNIQTLSAIT